MLSKAKKPLFLAGGGVNIAHANEEFTKLVDMTNVPVVTTVMGRGAIPTTHPLYIGNLGMHGAYAVSYTHLERMNRWRKNYRHLKADLQKLYGKQLRKKIQKNVMSAGFPGKKSHGK